MLYILIIIILVTAIPAWITAVRMRRKVTNKLGRKATNADLTSMTTWMQVAETEKTGEGKKPQN
jgi:hypothetical protein